MNVAIVTVGDELLAGDTVNTNATWLCDQLDDRGVSVVRVTTVPDSVADIAAIVDEYRAEYDAVIVTGGLGPTHDDVTMEAVAAALGRDLEPNDEALAWLTEHGGYTADDLVDGTTDLPEGARMLPNRAGVAPGAAIENVYVLPGVPEEMKTMFEDVSEEFAGESTYTETLVVDEPESALVDHLYAVQERFGVSIGSYPGGNVRLKVTDTDQTMVDLAVDWLRERVDVVEPPEDDPDDTAVDSTDCSGDRASDGAIDR